MSRESPTLKIGATLLQFGRGAAARWQARLGVLHKDAPTAAVAKRELAEDVSALLCDPEQLLDVALEAAARNDVDVAAVAARRGFRLAPPEVRAGDPPAEPAAREVVVQGRRLVEVGELEDGMLVACEWRGQRGYPVPHLALVQTRQTVGPRPATGLFVEWVASAEPVARGERDPALGSFAEPLQEWPSWWRPGEWSGEWAWHLEPGRVGEIEVLASGLPRGVSAAEVRRLAELAGWPDRFLGPEAELRRLVRAVLGVALEGDAARRTALVAEAVGRLRAAESSRAALLRIVDQTAEEPLVEPHAERALTAWMWAARTAVTRLGLSTPQEVAPRLDALQRQALAPEVATALRRMLAGPAASLSAIRRAVAEVEPDGMRREAAERALVALLGEGSP